VGSERRRFTAIDCVMAIRGHKVDDFGTNRKSACNFLLVINSNHGHILRRFWDTATYWPKNVSLPNSPPFEFLDELYKCWERSLWAVRRWRFCHPSLHHSDIIPACKTDGEMDRPMFRRGLCIASYVNALLKSIFNVINEHVEFCFGYQTAGQHTNSNCKFPVVCVR